MDDTLVIVRCYGGEPRICLIYQVKDNTVFVTDRAGMKKMKLGESGPYPIGFPRCDVFEYSTRAEMQIKGRKRDAVGFEWGRLKLFSF